MESIASRVKELIKELGISQNEFADRIRTDRSNLSKQLNGRLPVGDVLVNKIVVGLGISKKWLTEGDGEKYILKPVPSPSGSITIHPEMLKDGDACGTKVYDIDVTAGPSGRALEFSSEHIVGSLDLPSISRSSHIVKVSGDSMSPVINNGEMLVIREVKNNLIYWGRIYVVVLEDYRMVKYIRKHVNPETVILRSANPNYDDIEIPKTEIKSLFLVENIIHMEGNR